MEQDKWVNPKIIIGNKATGDLYFRRIDIEEQIVEEIKKGNHVLVAAPRRVGKTSIMYYLSDNCEEGWTCILENIQGIESEIELYKRIYELILSCLSQDKQVWAKTKSLFKSINIEELGVDWIVKFGDKKKLDYKLEIDRLIPQLPKDIKVVLFLDELPEILHQLNKKDKREEANSILKNLRRWRQGKEYKSLCFVVTGSIGLHHIVANITGRVTDNNDYGEVNFEPFNYSQGYSYIDFVTEDATVKYNSELKHYLLDKIGYKIPYFIAMLIHEINKRAKGLGSPEVTREDIDMAFSLVVDSNKQFADWKNRLAEYFSKAEAFLMNLILIKLAHSEKLSQRQLFDMAVEHEMQSEYMNLVTILKDDGYIVEVEDGIEFLSPFLAAYWKKDNPIVI